jgi:hypothetical protein
MTGCIFKRKFKSCIRWGYLFFGGWDENGKRIQIFKSGFPTKDGAAKAVRIAIENHEAANGRVMRDVGSQGRRTWGYSLGDTTRDEFETKAEAERALQQAFNAGMLTE